MGRANTARFISLALVLPVLFEGSGAGQPVLQFTGDIVLLASDDKVPADLRLLHSRSLQIDESALAGESLPVEKRSGVLDQDTTLADRANMAYSSTLVTYGTAVGVVTGTGDDTEIGRISELIASAEVLATPLTRKIARFSH